MIPHGSKRTFRFPWRSRRDVRSDIREEFQFHLDMRTAELVESGLDEPAARAQALREFGDQAAGAAACARVDTRIEWRQRIEIAVADLVRDAALGVRLLVRRPWFSAISIVTLALGIGANAAIYAMFEQTLSRPLPVRAPGELVNLAAPGPKPGSDNCNQAGSCETVFSLPMYDDLARLSPGFAGLAAHRAFDVTLMPGGSGLSEWAMGMLVSGNYFDVLGLRPAAGRLLTPADVTSRAPVAVLSYDYWRTRFNADPSVLGGALLANGHSLTIVGVAPEGFAGTTLGFRPAAYLPITARATVEPGADEVLTDRRNYWVYVFGRRAPGTSLAQAQAAINEPYRRILDEVEASLQTGLSDQTLARFRAKRIEATDGSRGQSRLHTVLATPLTLLVVVAGVVLLIACANVANLQLARAAGRATEMAVRLSIGGNRRQLVRQLLVESCLLAAGGGLAGILVARWTLDAVAMLLPRSAFDMAVTFTLDWPAMLFAAGLSMASGVLFGLVPAIRVTRPDILSTLKDQSGQPSGARSSARARTVLCTAQIGLAMALLVCAGLFVRSLVNVSNVALGIDPDDVLTFAVAPGYNGYTSDETRRFAERLEGDLAAMPGVTSASASLIRVLSGQSNGGNLVVEGFTTDPDADTNVRMHGAGPDFFKTMRMPLLAGRTFSALDTAGQPHVAVVNEAFARKFNLGVNPVGRRLGHRGGQGLDIEIVGLIRDAKYSDVKRDVPAILYEPYRQSDELVGMYFYVRTALPAEQLLASIPPVVAAIDPRVPVRDLMTVRDQVRESIFLDRMISTLSIAFASLATLMAALGLYGVLTYTIGQRTREIGLRMALGASAPTVRVMILAQMARMTVAGGAAGLVAALGVGTTVRSLLFGLDGFDPLVVAASVVLLAIIAMAAALAPAMRAARIDPMRALRWD
ncbi:MAG: ABC transporter permease [Vicinamibacterales bacterium]